MHIFRFIFRTLRPGALPPVQVATRGPLGITPPLSPEISTGIPPGKPR
jgi:hypothetical protein